MFDEINADLNEFNCSKRSEAAILSLISVILLSKWFWCSPSTVYGFPVYCRGGCMEDLFWQQTQYDRSVGYYIVLTRDCMGAVFRASDYLGQISTFWNFCSNICYTYTTGSSALPERIYQAKHECLWYKCYVPHCLCRLIARQYEVETKIYYIPYNAKVSLWKTFAVWQTVSNSRKNLRGWCLVRPPLAKAFSRGRYTNWFTARAFARIQKWWKSSKQLAPCKDFTFTKKSGHLSLARYLRAERKKIRGIDMQWQ